MKILITGAAGFLGSNLCDFFLQRGDQIVGIDNFNDYYSPVVKEYNIRQFEEQANFKLYRADILDCSALESVFENEAPFQAVVHLAAWAGVTTSIDHPALYVRNNIEGTVNVAEMSVKHNVSCFVFASSSSVYGQNPVPFKEDMPIENLLSPYPVTKRSCELLLSAYSMNFGLPVTVVRFFNPLGKKMRPDLALPKLIRSCEYGVDFPVYWPEDDWDKVGRDYCYVGHMLEAINEIIHKPFDYEIFNLGNSTPVTLGHLFRAVETTVGRKLNSTIVPKRQGEMILTYADLDKSKEKLAYSPVTSVEESVSIYYDWYQKQDESYKRGTL
jgi:UDP-glucuronate 4-epimerase